MGTTAPVDTAIAAPHHAAPTTRPENPRVSIVVPTKNEAANVREVLPRLPEAHEVIVVDANSHDDTVGAAREVMPEVRVVTQTRRGKGNALACGFAEATGDIIVMFDADGSAEPSEITRFVDVLSWGADFAKGSRYLVGGGSDDLTGVRSWGNRSLNRMANLMFGTRHSDLCYGYNAFWADMLPALDLPPVDAPAPAKGMLWGDGFEIETIINCRMAAAGAHIVEVPSVEKERLSGDSNLNAVTDGTRVLRTLVAERARSGGRNSVGREDLLIIDRA